MNTLKNLKYVTAFNSEGEEINVKQAVKGEPFSCVECGDEMIARQGRIKRWHFAHKNHPENCSVETYIHNAYKRSLHRKLQEALDKDEPFPIEWRCGECRDTHTGDLLEKAGEVRLEKRIDKFQPDIHLRDKSGKPYIAIEVIVTHPPEEELLAYYQENKIHLIKVYPQDEDDLLDPAKRLRELDMNVCKAPKCPTCNSTTLKTDLLIAELPCRHCDSPMKHAFLVDGNRGPISGFWFSMTWLNPEEFTPAQLEQAREKGVKVQMSGHRRQDERYMVSTCPRCNAFSGANLAHDFFLGGEPTGTRYETERRCENCLENARNQAFTT